MKKVKIDALNKEVGQLALGGSPFGACYGAVEIDECGQCIKNAFEQGVTYIDTAPFYGQGFTFFFRHRIGLLMCSILFYSSVNCSAKL